MAVGSRILVVLASVFLVLAVATGYARRAVFNSDQFANRATAALEDENVRSLIAERVTDDVVLRHQSDLLAARPLIESATSTVVGSGAFAAIFRSAVRDVHRAVFTHDQDTITLTVSDVGSVVAGALQALQPKVAQQVRAEDNAELFRAHLGSAGAEAVRIARDVKIAFFLFALLTLACAAGAIALARDRRRAVSALGIGGAIAGVVLIVSLAVGKSMAAGAFDGPDEQAASRAVWDAFFGDLRTWGWIIAGSGAIVAAAAASLIRPVEVEPWLRRAAGWLTTEPERTWVRAARAVGLVVAGVLVLANRSAVLDLIVAAAGVYLIYLGALALLRLVYRAPEPGTEPVDRKSVV